MTDLLLIAALWLQHPPTPVPHGDHQPKHGGVFFMAPDVFHHLEGVIDQNEFKLYIYNNYTEPLDARKFQARVGDRPMQPAESGAYFRIPFLKPAGEDLPEVTAFVRFHENGAEERFDFIFVPGPPPDVLPDFKIPEAPDEIFREMLVRDARIQGLIGRGAWTELFNPALEAKDLALALNEKTDEKMTSYKDVALAIKKVVRGAWLLDGYGDTGNREKVQTAYRLFADGIADLKKVYAR